MLTVLFEYRARPGSEEEFERLYGPGGEWARFFAPADGYLGTELHRNLADPTRYFLIDRWRSNGDFERFASRHAAEYAERSRQAEALYDEEARLGRFVTVDGP